MAPADAIGPAFGDASRERHVDRATRAGHDAVVEEIDSMALDVDTPEDLRALAAVLTEEPGRAPSTAAELERLGLLG
jgi:2-phospho-L-lactate guanylyltransferase (CobY/MobA/RfbA family)